MPPPCPLSDTVTFGTLLLVLAVDGQQPSPNPIVGWDPILGGPQLLEACRHGSDDTQDGAACGPWLWGNPRAKSPQDQ